MSHEKGVPRVNVIGAETDEQLADLMAQMEITIRIKPRCRGLTAQSKYTERCKITWNLTDGFCEKHQNQKVVSPVSKGKGAGKGK